MGSVAPGTAVAEASRILEDHFELLTNFPQATPEEEAAELDGDAAADRAVREPLPQR
jgi:hypothetical protein